MAVFALAITLAVVSLASARFMADVWLQRRLLRRPPRFLANRPEAFKKASLIASLCAFAGAAILSVWGDAVCDTTSDRPLLFTGCGMLLAAVLIWLWVAAAVVDLSGQDTLQVVQDPAVPVAVAVESDGVEISVVGLPLEQSEAAASVEPALEQLKRLIQELKE